MLFVQFQQEDWSHFNLLLSDLTDSTSGIPGDWLADIQRQQHQVCNGPQSTFILQIVFINIFNICSLPFP